MEGNFDIDAGDGGESPTSSKYPQNKILKNKISNTME